MKLTYFQLETHLATKLMPAYVLSGDDWLLKQDTLKWVRKAAKLVGFNERQRLTMDASLEQDFLYNALYAGSLLADKRIIELDCTNSLPNKSISTLLKEYAENPSSDILLLIETSKADDKTTKSAWYQALEKIGVAVTIWPIKREQLPQWLMNRAKKYKLTMQHDAANLLADYVEGNLAAAAQTLEKIYLLQPQGPIDTSLIKTVLTDVSRFNVFDFVDQLLTGDTSRTLHVLESLKVEGTEPVFVLWAIARELRLLADMARSLTQGQTHELLFQKHRIFPKRQSNMRRFLSKHSADKCEEHLVAAAQVDRVLKGADKGAVWDSLQMLCLRLS